MARRILSVVLVLAMVLSLVPAVVVAEETKVVASPKAGTHTDAGHGDDCGVTSGWQAWTSDNSLPTSGNWYLTKDIHITGGVNTTGDLNLCLNGFVVYKTGTGRIYGTQSGAENTFTVCDCTAYEEDGVYYAGALTGGKMVKQDGGGAIFVRRQGTFKLYDGRITGNTYQNDTESTGGGAIMMQGPSKGLYSQFYMYGGELSNNKAFKADGTTGNSGGAIGSGGSAVIEIHDGTIKNNVGGEGGAISLGKDDKLTITGGTIRDNRATAGAAIYGTASTVKLSNVTITGNEATGTSDANDTVIGGSAIRAYGGMQLTIGDGTVITGNTSYGTNYSEGYGAAVLMGSASNKLTLTGQVYIADNTSPTTGVASVTFNKDATDTLYVNELAAGSYVEFATPKTVPAAAGEVIALNGTQSSWQSGWVAYMAKDGTLQYIGYENGAFTFTEAHVHTLCSDTGCQDHTDRVVYEPWTSDNSLPTQGNWYLTKDVTVSAETLLTKAETLNLCLNGKTVTGYTASKAHAYATTKNVASVLNISDCTAKTENGVYTAGKFTGFVNTHTDSGAAGIFVRKGSTLNLYDGIIEKCASASGGAALFFNESTGNIYGGLITYNKGISGTTLKHGGGVYLYKSTLTMHGGEISHNEGNQGGGVYLYGATLILKDGKINNNTAAWGGGVAFKDGGCSLDMQGGEICGNTASGNGGGVQCAYKTATVKVSGDAVVTDNKLTSGDANNVRLGSSAILTVGQMESGAKVGITVGADPREFSTAVSSDVSAYFPSDNTAWETYLNENNKLALKENTVPTPPVSDHKHTLCNDTGCTEHTDEVEFQAWTSDNSLPTQGNWYLTKDVTVSAETLLTKAETLNLCLNGKTVTGYTASKAHAYATTKDVASVLNISDCTAKTENGVYTAGKFTGFVNTHTDSGAAGIFVRKGSTLNLYDGIIEKCASASGGAALFFNESTGNIYGGLITGNKAYDAASAKWKNGGGVSLYKASLTVYGGQISNNEANYGGGINLADGTCVLDIRGGEITGNIARGDGGGIQAAYKNAQTKLSGEPVITGNTLANGKANNLRLGGTGVMQVENLGENASIGITATEPRAVSTKTEDYTKNFFSDSSKLQVIYQDEVLYMSASGNHKHCLCTGLAANGCDHETLMFVEWDDPANLPTSGNYYLSVDVEIASQARLEGGELNLCLNGHTIKVAENGGRAYYMTNGATLNISDCEGTGKFTGATLGAILSNTNGTDMEINLYNGSFTENHSNGSGGAIVVQGGCTFNMYGGKFTGNSAVGKLKLDDQGQPILDADGNQTYHSASGGAVYIGFGAIFNMYGGEISGNKSAEVEYLKAGATATTKAGGIGGGLYVATGSTGNLYGGKISGNTGYTGGGVFVSGKEAVLNLLGTEISGNSSTYGGGVISQTHSTVNMKAGKLTGNTAISGGGIYVSTGTTFNLTGGEIVANEVTGNGGGIYALSSTVNLSGGVVKNNKAGNGAGLYGSTTVSGGRAREVIVHVMEGALITDNEATKNGGGIMLSGHADMTAGEGSKIVMTGGQISKNFAKNAGGGIITQTKSALELSGGKIVNNRVTTGGGAGVYISTNTKLTMTGGSINSNVAEKSSGGGIYLLRSTATFQGGSVSYNTAAEGGGIKASGAKATFSGLSVVGNKAVGKTTVNATTGKATTSAGTGGGMNIGRAGYKKNGVQLYDTPVINIYSIYVADNTSTGAAGGILVQSKDTLFNMSGGTITGNEATNNTGGGLYLSSNVKATITGGTITGNKAKNSGAIHILNNSPSISGIKVYGNHADNAAGAITMTGKTTVVTLKDVEFYENTAGGHVGAVVVQGYATMDMENTKLYNNKAGNMGGAIYFSNPGYGNLKNVEIYENEAQKSAGAVFVGTNSIVEMDNVTIRDNNAATDYGGGIYNRGRLVIKNSKILNNTVKEGNGGGIGSYKVASILLADDAGVFVENTIITGNKAGLQGGGVYGHRGCPIYLTNCTVTDNTAGAEGGGVFADGRMGMQDVTVTGNVSGGEGFAVYLTPAEFDGHSYQTGHKRIGGNMIIKDNQGGDMYLGEGAALAITGEMLGEKSHVDITLHSGVLSQWVLGVYDYEGGDQHYVLTSGSRSVTDPEPIPTVQGEKTEEKAAENGDILLYAGVGVFVLAVAAAIVLLLMKKKKPAKAEKD